MKINVLALSFSALIVLTSCTKEKLSHDNSNPGSSTSVPAMTVVASEWMSASLLWSDVDSDSSLRAGLGVAVTQEMINNGTVLIYAKDQSSNTVKSFPARFDLNNTVYDSYSSVVEPNFIHLVHNCYRDGQPVTPVKNDNVSFRFILIGNSENGQIETSNADIVSLDEIKAMQYDEVVSLLGIDK